VNTAIVGKSTAVLVALVSVLLLPVGPTRGQGKASRQFLNEAFVRVTDNADIVKRVVGYGYADGVCVLAAWVDQGDSVSFIRPLSGGVSYTFLAAGDKDAQVVNLEILDERSTNVLKSDGKKQADAVLEFTPAANANYTLRLSLSQSRKNYPCICVATILKKDGFKLPLANLDTCSKKITDELTATDESLQKQFGKRLDFYKAKNQWALYGGVLKQGETLQVDNIALGQGPKGFIAVGDNNTQDVDLFLLDQNGRTVKSDESTNPVAVFVHEPGPQRHSLKALNYKGSAALVFMSTFDVITPR
jgi:hypothetical protein